MNTFVLIGLALIPAFLLTLVGTGILTTVLAKAGYVAHPNERSNHTVATPVGGGIAVMAGVTAAYGLLALVGAPLPEGALLIVALGLVLAGVSWIDDAKGISPLLRLGVHGICAAVGLSALPEGSLFGSALPVWLDRLICCLLWVYFTNLYNFMDGIDGITAVQTISISVGLFAAALLGSVSFAFGLFCLPLAGAVLGFLRSNWHPARIFMGDVGAIPLGFILGFALLSMAMTSAWVSAIILPLYYLADASITLVKRGLRGERIWLAHRQHAYQRAALATGRHDRVAASVALANLFLLTLALAALEPRFAWAALVGAAMVVGLLLAHLETLARGRR